MDTRPTERFTSRVQNYVRFRPDYPAGMIPLLQTEIGLNSDWTVADIGSGPGNLTRRFLDLGCIVYGVEPNAAMREAGDQLLSVDPRFHSIDGAAENTGLPGSSMDLVTAGQAFHWFQPDAARAEFQRILRPPGWVALIWNKRPEGSSPIHDEHSAMLHRYSTEYDLVRHRDSRADEGMAVLFGTTGYQAHTLPHEQLLDADAYWGRLLSSSYTPLPGQPGHDEIREQSRRIFAAYQQDGFVHFPYETQIFVGQILPGPYQLLTNTESDCNSK